MTKNQSNKPVNMAAVGLDKQTRRILEMVFHGPGKDDYVLVEKIDAAQACIFDLDNLEGMELWKDYRTRYPLLPTVILSLTYKEIAGTFYVKKPIEVHVLLKILSKIKQLVNKPFIPQFTPNVLEKSTFQRASSPRDAKLASEIALEEEEETLHQFCGYTQDINLENSEAVDKIYYEPTQYLQGFFEKAFVIGQQLDKGGILIEGLHTPVIFLQKQNQILCSNEFNNNKLRTMTLLPLAKGRLRMTTLGENEVVHYLDFHQLVGQPLDGFLWRVALWTSRGRVPKNTDLNKKIILLHWPNFTRLVVTPYALKISAFWMAQPHSLLETATLLNIPQRYVFAFFSAASAIRLALVDRRHEERRPSSSSSSSTSTSPTKRGLFQRLLQRLRNKE